MNRRSKFLSRTMLVLLAIAPTVCLAATGDVSFSAADKLIHLNPGNLSTAIDVSIDVVGGANVPALGWGMIVNIVPQTGATGTVQFNPPTIVINEPNLMPASQNPFTGFDQDFGGMSYGMLGTSATQLNAFSYYIAPTLGPAPSLDVNGNLSLPNGSGLVSLPLLMSANAAGDFLVTFDPDPIITGAIFATGLPVPNDIGVHPAGTHVAGILSVINPAGDYNRNGGVDAADYVLWRKTLGQMGPNLAADGSGNNQVDGDDFTVWRGLYGTTAGAGSAIPPGRLAGIGELVPEPTTGAMLLAALSTMLIRYGAQLRIQRAPTVVSRGGDRIR